MKEGLAALLDRQADVRLAAYASDVESALRAVDTSTPDLAIVDLALGQESGLELIGRLAARPSPPRILVLSMYDELTHAERALRAGAHGYVMKQAAPAQLLRAIRQVLAGGLFVSAALTERLVTGALGHSRTDSPSPIARLTDRELDVFRLIGTGLTTAEVAAQLHISPKTVETHRARIKQKIGAQSATDLLVRAVNWVEGSARGGAPA